MQLQQHLVSRSSASLVCLSSGLSHASCLSRMAKSIICVVASPATSPHSKELRTQCHLTSLTHWVSPRTNQRSGRHKSLLLRSIMAAWRCLASCPSLQARVPGAVPALAGKLK